MRLGAGWPELALAVIAMSSQLLSAALSPLYTSADTGLVILDNSNFSSHLSHRQNGFFVEFYNTWCGHCIKFAPTFKEFARDVRNWSSVVQLAVVDCAEDRNHDICREYEIYMYPSLRFFASNYTPMRDYSQPKPDAFEAMPNKSGAAYAGDFDAPQSLRKHLIDMLIQAEAPADGPNLTASSAMTKAALIASFPQDKRLPIIIIVEPDDSQIGAELILDFSANRKEVLLTRVQESSKELVNELLTGVPHKTLPQLLELHRKDDSIELLCCTNETTEKDKDLRKTFFHIIRDKYVPYSGPGPLRRPDVKVNSQAAGHDGQVKRPDNSHHLSDSHAAASRTSAGKTDVYMDDLYNALRYSIYSQVTMHQKLNSSQLEALKSFLRVVDEYFPFDDQDARPGSFIKLLSKWSSTKNHMISTDELVNEMGQFEDDYSLPDMKPYKTCQGSSSRFRGYPCSLWLLFHTMTVNEYLKQQSSDVDPPHRVLPMMRQFILNFFGCTECANNFAKESDGLEDSLTSLNSSVLWLWRTHNRVNQRLAGDSSEDPEHPKVQFPPSQTCPDCYFLNQSFNEGEVLKFLVHRYHPNHLIKVRISSGIHLEARGQKVVQAKHLYYDHDHQHAGPDGEPTRFVSSYYNILNRTDITIFVVLYVFSITLLIGLFVFFRMRGKRKKVSHHYQISNPNLRYMA